VGLTKVLSLLKSHNAEYLSGQDLSDVLKISRVAVWKHIKKIRSLGYEIESKQKMGYRLVKKTPLLLPWEITDGLKTNLIGKRVYYFDSIDSTQNYALKIASNPKENGSVIIAQRQTKGKGRMGRKWVSPAGGIWMSIIIHPEFDVSVATLFPIASSLALAKAIQKTFDITPKLKWPNDVTINGKKLAGMLIDASIESERVKTLVLGVGINFNVDSSTIEKNIKKTANFYGVTALTKNTSESPIPLVQMFLYELEKVYFELNNGKIKRIIDQWTKLSSNIGKTVTITTPDGNITGKSLKIDDDGALVIKRKTKNQRILAGDISNII
jgi:BirA family biotin operon repressor/biotin-[acetyl-CoA-carboxylase] ligase